MGKKNKNEVGSSLIGAMLIMMMIGFAGAGIVTLSTGNQTGSVHDIQNQQAFYIGQAGLERSKLLVSNGSSPDVTNTPFADGTYTVTSDPDSSLVTVASYVGDASKTQTIGVNFAKDCITLDTSQATFDNGMANDPDDNDGGQDKEVHQVYMTKTCNTKATLTSMTVDWNYDNCVLNKDYAAGEDISGCPDTNGASVVKHVHIDTTTKIYNPGGGGGTNPGNTIDVTDSSMTDNNQHELFWRLQQTIPNGAIFYLTLHFSDGSAVSSTFQIKNKASFTVTNGSIVADPDMDVSMKVICSLITYGSGGPSVPVKLKINTSGNSWNKLFSYNAVKANDTYSTTTGNSGTTYKLQAYAKYGSWSATYDSSNTIQVKTLVNGDTPPPLQGFGGQQSVSASLAPYLDSSTGKIKLTGTQVIQLFELGTDMTYNPTSPAADFQDLVVLYTIQ